MLINPSLIAHPDIFDAVIEEFELIRHIEHDEYLHVLIVEHNDFEDTAEGSILPFYNVDFIRNRDTGETHIEIVKEPIYHPTLKFICQRKQEPPKAETPESPEEMFPGLI